MTADVQAHSVDLLPGFHSECIPQQEEGFQPADCVVSGFGAFVDKTVLPYTNTNPRKLQKPCDEDDQQCQAAFGYKHVLSLTPKKEKFREKVAEQFISGNLDSPEGSLDAMMQATVCRVSSPPEETFGCP